MFAGALVALAPPAIIVVFFEFEVISESHEGSINVFDTDDRCVAMSAPAYTLRFLPSSAAHPEA